jgi:DNA-nicking Smr family endonuclease
MSRRGLSPEEEALWRRVTGDVTPLGSRPGARPMPRIPMHMRPPAPAAAPGPPPPARAHAETLDRGWDRKLGSGKAEPDRLIDLHGLNREAARDLLARQIESAHRRGERLMLVITGKGAAPGPEPADLMRTARPVPRGAIRAELPRWLADPALSARIAAVRQAHPRHGGAGAVYLVLRRHRPERT